MRRSCVLLLAAVQLAVCAPARAQTPPTPPAAPSRPEAAPDRETEHVLAFGGQLPFEELWTWAPPAGDEEPWAPGVPSRFAALATRLWEGPLQWERL